MFACIACISSFPREMLTLVLGSSPYIPAQLRLPFLISRCLASLTTNQYRHTQNRCTFQERYKITLQGSASFLPGKGTENVIQITIWSLAQLQGLQRMPQDEENHCKTNLASRKQQLLKKLPENMIPKHLTEKIKSSLMDGVRNVENPSR